MLHPEGLPPLNTWPPVHTSRADALLHCGGLWGAPGPVPCFAAGGSRGATEPRSCFNAGGSVTASPGWVGMMRGGGSPLPRETCFQGCLHGADALLHCGGLRGAPQPRSCFNARWLGVPSRPRSCFDAGGRGEDGSDVCFRVAPPAEPASLRAGRGCAAAFHMGLLSRENDLCMLGGQHFLVP